MKEKTLKLLKPQRMIMDLDFVMCKKIVENYNGDIEMSCTDNIFSVAAIIPYID